MRVLAILACAGACVCFVPSVAGAAVANKEMTDCAALGSKHPGSAADIAQGNRMVERFKAAGLETSVERFRMPVWEPGAVSVKAIGAGAPKPAPAETFAYGATGNVTADVVDAGDATPATLQGMDLRGKIVMVNSAATHRTVQALNIVRGGGLAMLYVSGSPANLIQTGAVAWAHRLPLSIPAVTVGNIDGGALRAWLRNGGKRMSISVEAERVDKAGRNIIGIRKGTKYPDRYVIVGGHYDSWHAGAVDNCTAVGSMLEMVEQSNHLPAYTTIFAAWDAEEPGLVGSGNWVLRHPELIPRTVVNLNLEMTSVATYLSGMRLPVSLSLGAQTGAPALHTALLNAAAENLYTPVFVPISLYRSLGGGLIPTDLEHFYGQGIQGFSTASSTPYYHTTEDVAGTVIPADLQRVSDFLADALKSVDRIVPSSLEQREVPKLEIRTPAKADAGAPFTVDLTLAEPGGKPIPGKAIEVLADQRDSWALATTTKAADLGGGRYRWTVPAGVTDADLTRIRARIQDPDFIATAYATVDQRGGGALGAGSPCRKRTATLKLRNPHGKKVKRVKVGVTSGKARVVTTRAGRRIKLDLRRAKAGTVTLKVATRLKSGRLLRQARLFRRCG